MRTPKEIATHRWEESERQRNVVHEQLVREVMARAMLDREQATTFVNAGTVSAFVKLCSDRALANMSQQVIAYHLDALASADRRCQAMAEAVNAIP